MAPHFPGQMQTLHQIRDWFASKCGEFFGDMGKVMALAHEDAGQDVPEVLKRAQEAAVSSPRDGR